MKFTLTGLKRLGRGLSRGWPAYLLGGHVRTSTVVLVVAFIAVWWTYSTYQQSNESPSGPKQVPATQVVPPGYVPDPNYTWVPRTRVQQPTPTPTWTPTTTTTTTPPTTTTTTTTPPPLIPPIVLPPPFGPPPSTSEPPEPEPGPAPMPPPPTPAP
ncbi:MAG: hypothetical protein ACRDTS_11070 [Mycobacterium sp.]